VPFEWKGSDAGRGGRSRGPTGDFFGDGDAAIDTLSIKAGGRRADQTHKRTFLQRDRRLGCSIRVVPAKAPTGAGNAKQADPHVHRGGVEGSARRPCIRRRRGPHRWWRDEPPPYGYGTGKTGPLDAFEVLELSRSSSTRITKALSPDTHGGAHGPGSSGRDLSRTVRGDRSSAGWIRWCSYTRRGGPRTIALGGRCSSGRFPQTIRGPRPQLRGGGLFMSCHGDFCRTKTCPCDPAREMQEGARRLFIRLRL